MLNRIALCIASLLWIHGDQAKPEETYMTEAVVGFASETLGVPQHQVEVEPMHNQFFHQWRFWRASDGVMPPEVVHIATRGERTEVVEWDSGLRTQMSTEEVALQSPQEAVDLVGFFLSVSRPLAEMIESIDEIPSLDSRQAERLRSQIYSPHADLRDRQSIVDAWVWENGELEEIRFTITPTGIDVNVRQAFSGVGPTISLD